MINTNYFERLAEQNILERLSRDDLIVKLKEECGLDCNPHFRKKLLVKAILDHKYGENHEQEFPKVSTI